MQRDSLKSDFFTAAPQSIFAVPSLRIAPARGPPLWEAAAEQAVNDPQWDQADQPGPEVEFDQRIAW